ncbi:MAG: F0F1 ATP synthase subunit A [Anaerolineae bacterium]|nr:F0F1 ATP synthase subunit A [Anaerolineae bacterium]
MGIEPQNMIHLFGDVWITSTVTSTWVMMLMIVGLILVLRRLLPTALEMVVEFLLDTTADVLGRSAAERYLPFLGTLALFIAFSNVIGVIPGMVTPTRDLSTPLALALLVFFAIHYYGVRAKGVVGYLKDYASPLYLAILIIPLNIIGEISRTLSLSLRLFGNVVSGEIVVAVVFTIIQWIAPLPLVGLSMFTGLLQAFIFTILTTVYISNAVTAAEV